MHEAYSLICLKYPHEVRAHPLQCIQWGDSIESAFLVRVQIEQLHNVFEFIFMDSFLFYSHVFFYCIVLDSQVPDNLWSSLLSGLLFFTAM